MGVPKFYRWISERYPCLSEVVKEYQIPEFDNLYLDMNGIIHNCSHPNDDDPHFRITEEKIIADIFHYIEVLFRMIQPRKVFFMAIDGVAPRAKMNQQRGRRFRSAKEAELNEKKAKDRGEKLPEEERFDSNCITPGTPFMDRLHQQLKYFVSNKVSTDGLWKGTRVILSGHETPGEGEHKIMDFIRHEKSLPGYDPNTRHCLYGLDADLLMLGLCTHDPHFSLLREEVRFGGKKGQAKQRTPTPEETTFHLLHLSLLREYLDYEFQELHGLPFYNIENIVDDWVLMGFLVGNDFIPNLPHMHINKGALPELFATYKSVLPSLGGYLNEDGFLNLQRFEKFMIALSQCELDKFDDIYSDSKWLEGKTAKKTNGKTEVEPTPGPGHVYEMLEGQQEPGVWQEVRGRKVNSDLQRLMNSTAEFDSTDDEDEVVEGSEDRGDFYQLEFRQHKRDYYCHKLGYQTVTPQVLQEQAECYVRAIQWNLHYYYNGCVSWSWFYPHHFAPWITDIRGFTKMEMGFTLSEPFKPFEQLLAVLPSASKALLPSCFQWLMTSQESPIIDYYPLEFEQDLNGKQQEWEAVVMIPFIDEKRLLEARAPLEHMLNPDEKRRNSHGPMMVVDYSAEDLGPYPAPAYFPTVERNHALARQVWRQEWDVPVSQLRKGLMEGVRLDVFFPGFPTLKHIRHTAKLQKAGVRVFEQSSRGENMMLTLEPQGRPDVREVAKALLDSEVWVGWPHLVEAKVVAVQGQGVFIDAKGEKKDGGEFEKQARNIESHYSGRYGVSVGKTAIVVHACPMSGRKFVMAANQKGRITLEKQWHHISQEYALQAIVKDILVEDKQFQQYCTVEELFPQNTTVFMLGNPHYGCKGNVLKIAPEDKGRIKCKFEVPEDLDLTPAVAAASSSIMRYENSFRAAKQLAVSGHVLSRLTGTVYIMRGAKEQQADSASKSNIGLNLKFNKRSEEVCGYTRNSGGGGGGGGQWQYSQACVAVLMEYQTRFPEVFEFIASSNNSSNDMFHETDVFRGPDGPERAKDLVVWLENLPCHTAPRQPFGTETLEEAAIKKIEESADALRGCERKMIVMQVNPRLLYLPNQLAGSSLVEPGTTFSLYDRVVNIREGFSVPLGLRGTLIRVQKGAKQEDNLYDVLFDEPFAGGLALRCSPGRGYRLPGSALINLSFKTGRVAMEPQGERKAWSKDREKPRAVVQPFKEGRDHHQQQQQQGQARPNVWEQQGAPRGPTGHVAPNESRGGRGGRGRGAVSAGKGRGKQVEQGGVQILKREAQQQEAEGGGNFQDMWAAMAQNASDSGTNVSSSSSVADMEQNLKAMLNIGGGKRGKSEAGGRKLAPGGLQPGQQVASSGHQQLGAASQDNPLLALLNHQSFCSDLLALMNSTGRGQPRYDHIRDPVSGGINAQVTLDDGNIFHSPLPMQDVDAACELAAKLALESVRKEIEGSRATKFGQGGHNDHRGGHTDHQGGPVGGRGVKQAGQSGRGRGRGSKREEEQEQQAAASNTFQPYQPWAQPAEEGGAEVKQEQKKPNIKKQEKGMAGTAQMDIRFRDQQQPPASGGAGAEQQPAKPQIFGVPLQVVKKSVKPVVKQKADEEQEKESMEAAPQMTENKSVVENKDLVTRSNSSSSSVGSKGRGSLSKESTPARGGGAARKPRKPRIAANFGGVPPPQ